MSSDSLYKIETMQPQKFWLSVVLKPFDLQKSMVPLWKCLMYIHRHAKAQRCARGFGSFIAYQNTTFLHWLGFKNLAGNSICLHFFDSKHGNITDKAKLPIIGISYGPNCSLAHDNRLKIIHSTITIHTISFFGCCQYILI